MSGKPWEKYGSPAGAGQEAAVPPTTNVVGAAAVPTGPWSKYAGAPAAAAPAPPDTIQEMHPDFTAADRLVTQNFANGNDEAVNYLQQRHPNLDVNVDKETDQIRARAKGSNEPYRVLDPKTGFLGTLTDPKELALTVGGHGYDLASGLGTGAATAAGALAGGAGGLGVGALPGAALAGGAAGAGFEGLRQGIGKLLGINQGFDPTKMAVGGAAGAVSPLLFGTGAGAAQVAEKALANGVDEGALMGAQRGLLGRGYDAVKSGLGLDGLGTKLASATSGATPAAIEAYAKNPAAVEALANPDVMDQSLRATASKLKDRIREVEQGHYATYKAALGGAGDVPVVDMADVAAPLRAKIEEAVATSSGTDSDKETIDLLKAQYKKFFTRVEKVPSLDATGKQVFDQFGEAVTHDVRVPVDKITPLQAADMSKKLSEVAGLGSQKAADLGVANRMAGDSADEMAIKHLGGDMRARLKNQLQTILPPEATAALEQYGRTAEMRKEAASLLKTPGAMFQNLRNADKTPNTLKLGLFQRLDQNFGSDLVDQAGRMQAVNTFAKPSATALSLGGSTSTSKTIPMTLAGAGIGSYLGNKEDHGAGPGGFIGAGLGAGAGAFIGGPAAIKRYINLGIKAKAAAAAAPVLTGGVPMSAWNMMQGGVQ